MVWERVGCVMNKLRAAGEYPHGQRTLQSIVDV